MGGKFKAKNSLKKLLGVKFPILIKHMELSIQGKKLACSTSHKTPSKFFSKVIKNKFGQTDKEYKETMSLYHSMDLQPNYGPTDLK